MRLHRKNEAERFRKEGERLHFGKKIIKAGTERIFIRFVPLRKRTIGAYGPFFYGTGKTGTGQVSFTRKNSSQPFHFFRSCKRPLNISRGKLSNQNHGLFESETIIIYDK